MKQIALSAHDISRETGTGTATAKFILKRFETWFRPEMILGQMCYSRQAIPLMLHILDYLDQGMLPSEIETALRSEPPALPDAPDPAGSLSQIAALLGNIRDTQQSVKSVLEDIAETQSGILQALKTVPPHPAAPVISPEPVSSPKPADADLDDLFALVSDQDAEELDDLNLLLEELAPASGDRDMPDESGLDDLYQLIDDPLPQSQNTKIDLNDPVDLDDLSRLIEDLAPPDTEDDILSSLPANLPPVRPNIRRDQNLEKYKAAVMKSIVALKTAGLTPEQATRYLNQEGVETISGKPRWSEQAIRQIYTFINTAG